MIINSIQELRIAAPAHALDSIDGMIGFIDNSEHDVLEEKLGTPLYNELCKWYAQNTITHSKIADYKTGYFNRMLLLCQRVVAFDALARASGMQIVSVNNAGINQLSADDYKTADNASVEIYRKTCQQEAHAALNQLLRQLEKWCQEEGATTATLSSSPDNQSSSPAASPSSPAASPSSPAVSSPAGSGSVAERTKIVTLWRQSSYYYLAAAMLIPSCQVMQRYLNIYDNREKFIQLLPDLRFIQEEQLAPAIGEPLMLAVIAFARDGVLTSPAASSSPAANPVASFSAGSGSVAANPVASSSAGSGSVAANPVASSPAGSGSVAALSISATMSRLVHRLRKVMTALLVGRTGVLKYNKEQKIQAHDDGVRMLQNVVEYLRQHQDDFPEDLVKDADWYVAPAETTAPLSADSGSVAANPAVSSPAGCGSVDADAKRSDSAACWTPPLF